MEIISSITSWIVDSIRDRYEILAVCIAAMNAEILIAHIHGGEATEGLIDEAIRHSITKNESTPFCQYRSI